MKHLIVILMLLFCIEAHGNWAYRCQKYAWDKSGKQENLLKDYIGVTTTADILWWDVDGVLPPDVTATNFPSIAEGNLILTPELLKYSGGKWILKTQADLDTEDAAHQAAKSVRLKAIENKMISMARQQNVIATNAVTMTRQDLRKISQKIHAMAPAQQPGAMEKLMRYRRMFDDFDGDVNDIQAH